MESMDVEESTQRPPFQWSWKHTKRRIPLDDDFFAEGDIYCHQPKKLLVSEVALKTDTSQEEFACQLHGCIKTFTNLLSYEMHYNNQHKHFCMECRMCLPTLHLLELHIAENHNPMFEKQSSRQPSFTCLTEGCQELFWTASKRKDHMIKVHKYPSNFRFDRVKKKRQRKKVPMKSNENAMDVVVDNEQDDPSSVAMVTEQKSASAEQVEQTESHISSSGRRFVYNVPKHISFGHGVTRGFHRGRGRGQSRNWHQFSAPNPKNIEEMKWTDVEKALKSTCSTHYI